MAQDPLEAIQAKLAGKKFEGAEHDGAELTLKFEGGVSLRIATQVSLMLMEPLPKEVRAGDGSILHVEGAGRGVGSMTVSSDAPTCPVCFDAYRKLKPELNLPANFRAREVLCSVHSDALYEWKMKQPG